MEKKDINAVEKKIKGLSEEEALKRLEKDGENTLAGDAKVSYAKMFAGQFKDVMVIILLISTVISVFLGEIYDAITIILIVLINSILGFVQEFRTEKTLETLKNMTAPTARVIRDGNQKTINASDIVKGDYFLVEAGDRVPCDGVVVSCHSLCADESILTGESVPVEKNNGNELSTDNSLNKSYNIYMGTVVTKGNAICKAIATGMYTQMGQVSGMLEEIEDDETPLQKKLAELGKIVAVICICVCVVVFVAGILRGEPVFDMFMTGITIAIAAIPEGLPATVTIALALAVRKMLKRNALVHKLHSVETLGCASVICSDKTGTITENKMTVTDIYTYNHKYEVTGTGYKIVGEIKEKNMPAKVENNALMELLYCGCICNNANITKFNSKGVRNIHTSKARSEWVISGDPTEAALLIAAAKAGINEANTGYKRYDEIPFESETKYMTVFAEDDNENKIGYIKGAIDVILSKCKYIFTDRGKTELSYQMKKDILRQNEKYASMGLRVLAFAFTEPGKSNNTCFLGMCAMSDPPRVEAKKAISICAKANIKTVMITGDHKLTACAVAKQAGIYTDNSMAMTGEELRLISDDKLDEIIEKVTVFARVNPADKLRIVRAFGRKGHIVAMTGDGVNDAPAVKEADIGVSMGVTGTDVTKQAADVILLDDNFATLVCAVEQGRTIYSNIRKFVRYLLSCNIGEVITMFLGILMGLPMVLLPTQILLVNLLTDGLPAVALGVEPPNADIMSCAPRKSTDGFFSNGLMTKIVFRGIMIGLCTLGCFVCMIQLGFTVNVARTAALITLVVSQLIHVFECKSEIKTIFSVPYFNNIFLVLAVILSLLIVLAAIYLPSLQLVFSTIPLKYKQLFIAIGFSLAVPIASSGFHKIFK